jgi:tetratricopeptide (TPR) repeat protein
MTNLLLHTANGVLVFLLCWRLFRGQAVTFNRALACSIIASLVFFVHPLQTESVAYLAGRSELVCGLFVLSALTVFCWNLTAALTWKRALLIQALYIAACLSKEQAAVAPVALLAVDVVLGQRSFKEALKRGARLYLPIAAIGVAAIAGVFSILARSTSAGLNVSGFAWYEYALTQPGVWLLYLRLAVFPIGQNADYDLPLARTFWEPGTFAPLLLLTAAGVLMWRTYRKYPLAAGGLLLFAVLLAPTSSIVPIQDVAAERRMYLPLFGLLLAASQVLVRARFTEMMTAGLVGIMLILGGLTFVRAKVWSNDVALWTDVTAKSPNKSRGYTHLLLAHLRARRCSEAAAVAQRIPEGVATTPEFMGALGQAYACEQKMDEAVKAFEYAAQKWPSTGRLLALASAYSAAGRFEEAIATEQKATSIEPRTPYDFLMLEALQKRRNEGQSRARSAPANSQPRRM